MGYSNYHKSKNPLSPSRLDNAFQASKIEGGPGDPVKMDKVTRTTTTDINPETGMKRYTTVTTRQGETETKSYKDAYKNVHKNKYPTLQSFVEAAKKYPKEKDAIIEEKMVMEQMPIRPAKITSNITPEIKIKKIETDKDLQTSTIDVDKKTTKSSTDKSKNKPDKDKSITFTTSGGDGLYSKDLEVSCKMDPDAANRQECKKTKEAQKQAKKSSIYRTKKDGTQKIKKKLMSPGDYFYSKGWRKGRGFGKNLGIVLSPYK